MAKRNVVEVDSDERLIEIRSIRSALLIGLECFGEVERVIDRHDSLTSFSVVKPDAELKPLHPTGSAETVCKFAAALRYLESMELEAANA